MKSMQKQYARVFCAILLHLCYFALFLTIRKLIITELWFSFSMTIKGQQLRPDKRDFLKIVLQSKNSISIESSKFARDTQYFKISI